MPAFFSDPPRELTTFSAESVTKSTVQEVVDTPLSKLETQGTTMCEVVKHQLSQDEKNVQLQKNLKNLVRGVETLAEARTAISQIMSPEKRTELESEEDSYSHYTGLSR
jgi:hypothetical protein